MSTQANGVNTAPNTVSTNNTLAAINTNQSVTSAAPTAPVQGTRLVGKQYDKLYAPSNKSSASAPVPSEKAAEKTGGDDIFSAITKVISCVTTAVANPLSLVTNAVDLVGKATKK